MSSFLSDHELKQLAKLGKNIIVSLECDINDMGVPCRTDRLEAVKYMISYLKLHDLRIYETDEANYQVEI